MQWFTLNVVRCFMCVFAILLFNEFFIYYVKLFTCKWPLLKTKKTPSEEPLRFLILSDPHLLGEHRGHWFDKLRREWQIFRSYQTALQLFDPEAVFILGDLHDEGKWATDEQWQRYVATANEIFKTPKHTDFHVIIGNHDAGFHDHITKPKLTRFFQAYNTNNVQVLTLKKNLFVTINSMGLEDDRCFMCSEVEEALNKISLSLNCSRTQKFETEECLRVEKFPDTKPILLQHFPLYRESDASCSEVDAVSADEVEDFIPKHHCVSEDASRKVLQRIKPRLILSGHTHSACSYYHGDVLEISIPSFSWRNRNNPSFLLVSMTSEDFAISKCFLPQESTVILLYALFLMIFLPYIFHVMKHSLTRLKLLQYYPLSKFRMKNSRHTF